MQKLEIKQRPLLTRSENLAGVPAFVAEILARRGVESEQELELKLKHLLAPTMKGLPEAIQLMDQAIDRGQKIVIVGDYDADGATSTALMVLALRDMGANVEYLVPDRFKYGYGLTPAIADLAFVSFTPDLLITVDNGISSHDGVKQAQDHGMQVIITDHHLTTKPTPKAEAVVNPNQLGCDFPSKALAGVGVAFYILANLSTHRKKLGKSSTVITNYLDAGDITGYAAEAGYLPVPGLLVALGLVGISEDNADDEIDPTLRAKYVTQVGQYDMNFEGGASFGDIDAYNLGADLYLDKTFSVGLGFSDSDLEGNDVFTIRAKKFFNQQVSLEGSINFADNADIFGVRGAYRF